MSVDHLQENTVLTVPLQTCDALLLLLAARDTNPAVREETLLCLEASKCFLLS